MIVENVLGGTPCQSLIFSAAQEDLLWCFTGQAHIATSTGARLFDS